MPVNESRSTGVQTQVRASLPHLPGLDGLRALAVVAVLLYHGNLEVRGGFLGVESFFVLSGFLITSLLLVEWDQSATINLSAFWLRRARRLLPALLLVLLGTFLLAALLPRGEVRGLVGDSVAALAYIMNWHLIAQAQSYFDPLVRPPLLQHLWSLAVEEQFYLLWPLLFLVGMRVLRSSGMLLATMVLAALSIGLMVGGYEPGADPSRIYYGTDTRVSALLIGAALAFVCRPGAMPFHTSRAAGLLLDSGGLLAMVGLCAAFMHLYDRHPLLYRGGLTLVALATALVIVAVAHPRTRVVPWILGLPPLRWIGLRSYGIYLWHWPIFMVTRPYLDVPLSGWPLFALRIGVTVVIAAVSYRVIEIPSRHGGHLRGRQAEMPIPWLRGFRNQVAAWQKQRKPKEAGVARQDHQRGSSVRRPMAFMRWIYVSIVAGVLTSSATVLLCTAKTTRTIEVMVPTELPERMTPRPSATARRGARPTVQPLVQAALPAFDPALAAELQAILDETVADGAIPGAVLAISLPNQQPWQGASGLADEDPPQPMRQDTLIRIASITKMFTAVVVLQLVEEGRLALDATIETWLPGVVPDGERTTIRHLLQHTSGLYDYLEDTIYRLDAYEDPTSTWDPREIVSFAVQFESLFEPGTPGAWDYSSTNYLLLGMVVEAVTGRPLAQEVRERIIEPLHLTQTFFLPAETPAGEQARGYAYSVEQAEVSMSFAFGTANIVSSVDDVRRFAVALFEGQLLEAATLAMMTTFVDGHGQYNMPTLAYGFGLMRNQFELGPGPDGQPRAPELSTAMGHTGGFAGFRSALWFVPASGTTIVLSLNQSDTDPNVVVSRVLEAVVTHQGR